MIYKFLNENYNISDFENGFGDDDFIAFEMIYDKGKPFFRRLFLNQQEIENYLNNGTRRIYPNKEEALKDWESFKDKTEKEMGIPTKSEIANLYKTNDNFKKWFGKSAVVNSDGSPKIVYHGTGNEFEEFRDCGYIFLASSPNLASDYAYAFYDSDFQNIPIRTKRTFDKREDTELDLFNNKVPKHIEVKRVYNNQNGRYLNYIINKDNKRSMEITPWTPKEEIENFIKSEKTRGGVHPLYCRIENPYRMDARGRSWENIDGKGHIAEDYIQIAKQNGCDGIIIDNVTDGSGYTETEYIPFSPNQVKQAYNIGSFSREDNNMWLENVIHKTLLIFEDKIGGLNYGNRGDSFYTQERNIVSELSNYDLSGKVIYCNCDNPSMSNFYKFFKNNFNDLGLKGLYATYFDENPKMFFFNGSQEMSQPISSGRFQDNAEIMKRCDIVITNPPFSNSMASELIKMAKSFGKHVIMVGPNTIANQKEMFELIKNGQLNMGYTSVNRFNMPDGTQKTAPTSWWTTMDTKKPMFKTGIKYNPSNYQKYDNFDAIDIRDYREIPDDYYGYMGVSPKFLRALNRDQFEIVTKLKPKMNGKVGFEKYIIKRKSQPQTMAESLSNKIFENFKLLIN